MDFNDLISKLAILSRYYEESEGTILERILDQEIARIRPLLDKKEGSIIQRHDRRPLGKNSNGAYQITGTGELSGSKPMEASFGDTEFHVTSWKNLFHSFLEMLIQDNYCTSRELLDMAKYISINMEAGTKSGRGYDYNPKLGISIQANAAPINGEAIKRLCAKYKIPFAITVRWNGDNAPEGAETGCFSADAD